MNAGNALVVESVVVEHPTPAGGRFRALDELSFSVDGGSSVAVTGASGGGKSTLLGLLGGLARPSAGSVRIGGQEISALPESRRCDFRRQHIGYVYQADNLLPFLTLLENVQLPLALIGEHADVDRSLALLERLGLAGLAHRLPDQLSGGQRQRGAVARAVVHRPEVILADEPTGALDSDNAVGVIELLLDVQADLGATLVMITHDRAAARRLDVRLELADGKLQVIGRYVLARPGPQPPPQPQCPRRDRPRRRPVLRRAVLHRRLVGVDDRPGNRPAAAGHAAGAGRSARQPGAAHRADRARPTAGRGDRPRQP